MTIEKVALIMAGGSGMGAAAAKKLAADGFKIAILSSSGKGEQLARELYGFGVTGSNRSPDDMQKVVKGAIERWGRIDVLVNSSGHGPRGDILGLTDENWHEGLEVYYLNVVRAVRLVTPYMQQQKSGSIVNISSAWVVEPSELFPVSSIFRASLSSFTKIYAQKYARDNIRINNVLPGWIDSLPELEERRKAVPMQRYGRVEEVAATIGFLASDAAAYITSQNIRIDGGLMKAI